MRRIAPFVLALVALLPVASSRPAQADDPAEQAAKEIADAREQANDAADAYFTAESELDALAMAAQALEIDIADLQRQIDDLQARVEQIAVNRFTRSSASSSPLLNGFSTPEELMQVAALSAVINDTSDEDFDNYDSLQLQLASKKKELDQKRSDGEQQKAKAAALRDEALAMVANLKQVEAQRLQDENVRKALVAEEARRKATDAAAAAAEEAAATSTTFDPTIDPILIEGGGGNIGVPQTTVPVVVGAGGQTGGGGAGGRPGGAGGSDYGGPNWHCPTEPAAVAFGDTWGAPRSGGRRHEGVDMIGPIGTPIYAVVDGHAKAWNAELGGLVLSLYGADGNRYFYGHIDHYGKLGDVKTGDVIAYMGQTGNARFSVPHLHFEIHPAGGAAVNPYPTVRAHC
jgi:murein DD-endopeptidase MepM/ murein hydrolase activator NlpD